MEKDFFEPINGRLQICVSDEHKFGTDAFLLSDFARVKRKDRCVDLGTGCGIIPLLWFREPEEAPQVAYGLDIQPKAIDQMEKTVAFCGLKDRLIPVEGDLKEISDLLPTDSFTLVTCNPPYKAGNSGILNETDAHSIARHELLCTIDDVCRAAARLLKFGGRLCVCQRPERLLDTLEAMRRNKVEPKRLRFVQKRGDTAPWLFLVEGRKGSRAFLQVEAPLLIQNGQTEEYSAELRRIYRLDQAERE